MADTNDNPPTPAPDPSKPTESPEQANAADETAPPASPDAAADDPAAANGNGDGVIVDGDATAKAAEDDFLSIMMAGNFIEYASYVIKERAIPDVDDGLKPVQRRILHSLHQIDDGRFHKVANVIGHSMQYHPHGDASIGSALVVLANKEFYIDKQGNFGNIHTGDAASAARYIECRLTPLAREILFNPEITEFEDSYDGRNREPIRLPAKLPSLLMLGADGIAVGMSTRILPHNFNELIDAQIAILRGKAKAVYPDFLTGGLMDVSEYDDGQGKVKVRARIDTVDDKTLVIREVPAGTTTEGLMANIEDAVRHGKIKISQINDYTAENVEIEIKLPRGMHAKETIKRLYAYTDCEVNISSSIMVIRENEPVMMTVSEILQRNTDKLLDYLDWELQIRLGKLNERFHAKTLAQIFIENRIYKRIEECETWKAVIAEVHAGLDPFSDQFRREVTDEDIEHLLQLQIRRISKFDLDKNRQELDDILKEIDETQDNLDNLTRYAVDYLKAIKKQYGKEFKRRTEITDLGEVDARKVALKNLRVGHDRQNNFVGTEVKNSNKAEEPILCTEYDRLVLMRNDGQYKVVPVPEKLYTGPLKYVFKADREQVYSMLYRDRKSGVVYAKRFRIDSYIMDRDYNAVPDGCIIENIYTNYGVVVRCELKKSKRSKVDHVDVEFDQLKMRSAGARGFKITDKPVKSYTQLKRGTPEPEGTENDQDNDDGEGQNGANGVNGGQQQPEQPPEKPKPKAKPKAKTKSAAESKPNSAPEKTPDAPPEEKPKPPNHPRKDNTADVAGEWQKRSSEALKGKGKRLVDEDTPFFLE